MFLDNDSAKRMSSHELFKAREAVAKITGGESPLPRLSRREQLEGEKALLENCIESLSSRWLPRAGRWPLPSRDEMQARIAEFQSERESVVAELKTLAA